MFFLCTCRQRTHALLIVHSCHFNIGFRSTLKNSKLFSHQAKRAFSCSHCARKLSKGLSVLLVSWWGSRGPSLKVGEQRAISEGGVAKGHLWRWGSKGPSLKVGKQRAISEGGEAEGHLWRWGSKGPSLMVGKQRAISDGGEAKGHLWWWGSRGPSLMVGKQRAHFGCVLSCPQMEGNLSILSWAGWIQLLSLIDCMLCISNFFSYTEKNVLWICASFMLHAHPPW
jgi:hypothetical protein